jgi:hypothetical protein
MARTYKECRGMNMELNPNHPVTKGAHDNWHKIVALLMLHFEVSEVEISLQEIEMLASDDPTKQLAVVLHDTGKSLVLRLTSMADAERLAREAQ